MKSAAHFLQFGIMNAPFVANKRLERTRVRAAQTPVTRTSQKNECISGDAKWVN